MKKPALLDYLLCQLRDEPDHGQAALVLAELSAGEAGNLRGCVTHRVPVAAVSDSCKKWFTELQRTITQQTNYDCTLLHRNREIKQLELSVPNVNMILEN